MTDGQQSLGMGRASFILDITGFKRCLLTVDHQLADAVKGGVRNSVRIPLGQRQLLAAFIDKPAAEPKTNIGAQRRTRKNDYPRKGGYNQYN